MSKRPGHKVWQAAVKMRDSEADDWRGILFAPTIEAALAKARRLAAAISRDCRVVELSLLDDPDIDIPPLSPDPSAPEEP